MCNNRTERKQLDAMLHSFVLCNHEEYQSEFLFCFLPLHSVKAEIPQAELLPCGQL